MSKITFDYKDINLIPRKSIVSSRSYCDTQITINGHTFKLPIIPANMECVINEELAIELARNGYFYIMHRFNMDNVAFVRKMKSLGLIASISIGVNQNSYDTLDELIRENLIPHFITLDIAHGHSVLMERILKYIRSKSEFSKVFLIAGNVSTPEATRELIKWGADAIKIGIAGGSVCVTYHNTGFGSRDIQLYTVKECAKVCNELGVIAIADGSISHICDIAKSLTMGAKLVMIGGMMSGFKESPGRVITGSDGKLYQEYFGSASEHSRGKDGLQKNKHIEGIIKLLPYKGKSIFDFLEEIKQALQSSISYAGGINLECFKEVEYIIKTNL